MCIRHAKQECIIFQFDEKLNMQYILSEEEYKSLIPIKEYERIRNSLLDENARLENIINSLKCDLFMKSAKQERWINLYKNSKGDLYIGGNLCKSESEARKVDKDNEFYSHYKTVKIEWEE